MVVTFFFVQQISSSIKFSLLGCFLFISQENSKLHIVLWWNNIVFFTVQFLGLVVGCLGEVDYNRWFFSGIYQAGNKFAVFDSMDM